MSLPHYELRCKGCDETFEDDGLILECPTQHEPALLVAEYRDKRFEPDPSVEGMFRYRKWLPGTRVLSGAVSSVTYKSEQLNRSVGLPNVCVVFSEYWPAKGATLETPTLRRLMMSREEADTVDFRLCAVESEASLLYQRWDL